jgi:hypothetical protein
MAKQNSEVNNLVELFELFRKINNLKFKKRKFVSETQAEKIMFRAGYLEALTDVKKICYETTDEDEEQIYINPDNPSDTIEEN